MGLQDILTGMMNGPRGQRQPSSAGGGGMSPIVMALLGLLAYKALKGRGGQAAPAGGSGRPLAPGGTVTAGTPGGGLDEILGGLFGGKPGNVPASTGAKPGGSLSDVFPGGLGGLLGGTAAGSVLSGGLANVIKELQAASVSICPTWSISSPQRGACRATWKRRGWCRSRWPV